MQKLAKKWGPHLKGTRVTADPEEADEAPGQSRRSPVVLVGASRFAWLEAEGYFGGGQSTEDASGDAQPPAAVEPATDQPADPDDAGGEAEEPEEPEPPPSMQGLDQLTNDLALGEPGGGGDDGR